jgi:hypothetical protein
MVTLILRGEWEPYLETLAANVAYAQGPLGSSEWPLVGHLARVFDIYTLIELAVMAAIVGGVLLRSRRRSSGATAPESELGWLAALSLALCLIVLCLTGLWDQHALILHLPALLSAALAAPLFGAAIARARVPLRATALVVCMGLVLLLAGLPTPIEALRDWRRLPEVWAMNVGVAPEAQRLLTLGQHGSYARLGQNDDQGHAAGVPSWKLTCPRFHQYPFQPSSVLVEVLSCTAKSPVVLVAPSLAPEDGWTDWNKFVAEAEHLLATQFECSTYQQIRVCTRL